MKPLSQHLTEALNEEKTPEVKPSNEKSLLDMVITNDKEDDTEES